MSIIPLDLQRRCEQRWAARFARQAQKETVGLNAGARGVGTKVRVDEKPTLAEQGIDKNLAHQARTFGALSDERFEQVVGDARDAVTRAVKTVMRGADIELQKADYTEDVKDGALKKDPPLATGLSSGEAAR
jgi:hypothetical protein